MVALTLLATIVSVFLLELSLPIGAGGADGRVSIETLIALGSALRPVVLGDRQIFRLVTAIFLHANWHHLFINGILLLVLGVLLEKRIGRAWFTAIFLLSGLGGSITSLFMNPPNFSAVGSSGAVMGLLGTAFALSFREPFSWGRATQQLGVLRFLIPGVLPVFLSQSASSGLVAVDYWAHLGGAVIGGLIGGWLLYASRRNLDRPTGRFVMICALGLCCMMLPIGAVRGFAASLEIRSAYLPSETAAIALVSRAIELRPEKESSYFTRGYLRFALGQYQAAVVDFEKSVRLEPDLGFNALLLHVARSRLGATDVTALESYLKSHDARTWPAPIFSMMLGRLSVQDLENAAKARDRSTYVGQLCEARFYMAQSALLSGNAKEATQLLQAAVSTCPESFVESRLANAELKRLNP